MFSGDLIVLSRSSHCPHCALSAPTLRSSSATSLCFPARCVIHVVHTFWIVVLLGHGVLIFIVPVVPIVPFVHIVHVLVLVVLLLFLAPFLCATFTSFLVLPCFPGYRLSSRVRG
ncbi:hypothetical protein EV426DRAFT_616699 [Tirmania nivea]|nr:hypothetical protein EV426DRAFT_616699 [Tirmania nivea]